MAKGDKGSSGNGEQDKARAKHHYEEEHLAQRATRYAKETRDQQDDDK